MTALKQFLLGLMLLGAVTYFGGGGTFASFSAQTSNNGSSIASGTLTMNDTVNSATSCLSAAGTSNDNVNSVNQAVNAAGCDKLLTLTNVAPGMAASTAKVTILNSGSIAASQFSVWGSSVNATLNTAVPVGTFSSISVVGLEGPVLSGQNLELNYGSNLPQTFKASSSVTPPASPTTPVTINVTAPLGGTATATAALPIGATMTDTSSNTDSTATATNNMDCYDVKTTGGTATATKGDSLNFNPILGNPFCGHALFFMQETGAFNYCWYGNGAPGNPSENVSGLCNVPIIGVTLGTALTIGTVSSSVTLQIPSQTLNGNISNGDTLVVTSGAHTQTFTATQSIVLGTTGVTGITATSTTPFANFTFPIGSTVVDLTSASAMTADTTSTITGFDTLHNSTGRIPLAPMTANGAINAAAAVQLNGGAVRTFVLGLYFPTPPGINQNYLQGLVSTFGITWHLDQ